MLEIEYEFREEDLVRFNEMRFMQTDDYLNNLKKNRWIVPSIMVLISAFYYYYYVDLNSSAYILVIAILWAVLSPRLMLLDMRRQVLKNYTPKEKRQMFGMYTLKIDPASPTFLHETSPSGKHKTPWSEMVRLEYGKKAVYIYLDLTTALVIPVETVKKGNLEQFAEQVEKMIERYA
ncbi:MAG: YcxB family protein [Methylococcaceae bacterium]|nr:YcxB family protein [Methylococcaceae bacterium]